MKEETPTKDRATYWGRHSHCGPWGMHPMMWKGAWLRGARSYGARVPWGRASRAQRWMYENPSEDEIVAMLEEHQRDLEQQIEDVRTRIEEVKRRGER